MGHAGSAGRVVIVASRLPVRRVREGRRSRWETSPGGLVAAVEPVIRERGGGWVGWDGSAEVAPRAFEHDGFLIRPVPIPADEMEGFYEGFSNKTLWPLYHDALREPRFHRHWWRPYRAVNERFAAATLEVTDPSDMVWVHDYQLQLVPGLVREARPAARIGFFLHTPFPPLELFGKLPWRRQILEGMLGADVVGFQTSLSAQNFVRAVRRYLEVPASESSVEHQGRTVRIAAFPISIDVERIRQAADSEAIRAKAAQFRAGLHGRKILLGVDRLDYTKGIDTRLRAFEEVMRRGRFTPGECVFVQVAVPTREQVEDYAELRKTVDQYVGRINGTYATMENIAVHYIYRNLPFEDLVAMYSAADVMVVTPFRDGMNLVAKEYVASRREGGGVLVLSEFAGAALELKQAMLVNPYDIDGMSVAFEDALSMSKAEQTRRMTSLRRAVSRHDVYTWAREFLGMLASTGGVAAGGVAGSSPGGSGRKGAGRPGSAGKAGRA